MQGEGVSHISMILTSFISLCSKLVNKGEEGGADYGVHPKILKIQSTQRSLCILLPYGNKIDHPIDPNHQHLRSIVRKSSTLASMFLWEFFRLVGILGNKWRHWNGRWITSLSLLNNSSPSAKNVFSNGKDDIKTWRTTRDFCRFYSMYIQLVKSIRSK